MFLIPKSFWKIKHIKGKGRGVVVIKDIAPGTVIGDFIGKIVHPKNVMGKDLAYDLWYNENYTILPKIGLDGIHIINHSCAPNCAMYPFKGHTLYFALRHIYRGEELTVSYNLGPPDYETQPCRDTCLCGSPICRGSFHSSGETSKRLDDFELQQAGEWYDKVPGSYGQVVKVLPDYPRVLPDFSELDLFATLTKPAIRYKDTILPNRTSLRSSIRSTGKQMQFDRLGLTVYGIMNNVVISFTT